MASDKSTLASVSLAIPEKVSKLQNHEEYLKWQCTMQDYLKILNLWTYIKNQAAEPTGVFKTKLGAWKAENNKTCTAFCLVVDENTYSNIKDLVNTSKAWILLKKNFKPQGSGFFNDTFQKLDNLTLTSCKNAANYVFQFRNIVNELRNFSTKLKLDENWLIYQFHSNLGPEHAFYFEAYAQEHDPFNKDGEAKFTLSSAMHHFQNTIKNPSFKIAIDKSAIAFIAANMPAEQSIIQSGAQISTSNSRVLTVQKTIKYYIFCKRDYHIEDEYQVKHSNCHELKLSLDPLFYLSNLS